MPRRINSRAKGKNGELSLVAFLKEFGVESHRTAQHKGAPEAADVDSTLLAHIECKRTQVGHVHEWLAKVAEENDGSKIPVVFWRRNHGYWAGIFLGSQAVKLLKLYTYIKNTHPDILESL
jgi:hypothetical protein